MKKIIGAISILLLLVVSVQADPADAFHSEWVKVRATADEDGATFAAVYDLTLESNFANKDSSSVADGGPYQISPRAGLSNRWMFAICGKNYDVGADNTIDNTFSFNLIGWSKDNGMLQDIAEGDCILGTQAVIVYPDTGDAVGALVDESDVAYTFSTEIFTSDEAFTGVVAGMMAYVTSDNETKLTSGYYAVTTATESDPNVITMSGITSSADTTARVQINPAFWADTLSINETTKWTSTIDGSTSASGNKGVLEVINSATNEVAGLVVDLDGIEWIQWVIYDALPAQTGEAGDITVYGRKF